MRFSSLRYSADFRRSRLISVLYGNSKEKQKRNKQRAREKPKKNRKLTIESEIFYQANTKITAFSHCIDQILTCLLFPSEYWVDLGKRYVGPRRVYRLPPKCKERKDAMKNIYDKVLVFFGENLCAAAEFLFEMVAREFRKSVPSRQHGQKEGEFQSFTLTGFYTNIFFTCCPREFMSVYLSKILE